MYVCIPVGMVVSRLFLIVGRIFCILFGRSVTVVRSSFLRPRCTRLQPKHRKDSQIRDIQDAVVCLDVVIAAAWAVVAAEGAAAAALFWCVYFRARCLRRRRPRLVPCSRLHRGGRSSCYSSSHRSGCCCCGFCACDDVILGESSSFCASFRQKS